MMIGTSENSGLLQCKTVIIDNLILLFESRAHNIKTRHLVSFLYPSFNMPWNENLMFQQLTMSFGFSNIMFKIPCPK